VLDEVLQQSALFSDSAPQPTHSDDSDILNMSSQVLPVKDQEPKPEDQLPSYSQQQPSTGEAARVDYQKLFDQLRNVNRNQ
jgi:hypothetical protein